MLKNCPHPALPAGCFLAGCLAAYMLTVEDQCLRTVCQIHGLTDAVPKTSPALVLLICALDNLTLACLAEQIHSA